MSKKSFAFKWFLGALLVGVPLLALAFPLWLDAPKRSNPLDPKFDGPKAAIFPTNTPGSTGTQTPTMTQTPTTTVVQSGTSSPTPTSTSSSTLVLTDTPTSTASPSPTATSTETAVVGSFTSTQTQTQFISATTTQTVSPTKTVTPTATSTETPSVVYGGIYDNFDDPNNPRGTTGWNDFVAPWGIGANTWGLNPDAFDGWYGPNYSISSSGCVSSSFDFSTRSSTEFHSAPNSWYCVGSSYSADSCLYGHPYFGLNNSTIYPNGPVNLSPTGGFSYVGPGNMPTDFVVWMKTDQAITFTWNLQEGNVAPSDQELWESPPYSLPASGSWQPVVISLSTFIDRGWDDDGNNATPRVNTHDGILEINAMQGPWIYFQSDTAPPCDDGDVYDMLDGDGHTYSSTGCTNPVHLYIDDIGLQ